MTALLERLQKLWAERSPRERWVAVIAGCVLGLWLVDGTIVQPLEARIAQAEFRIEDAEGAALRAGRLAQRIHALRGDLSVVEEQIQPGAETNLLALIESLAGEAGIRNQLEAIKPRQGSASDLYPETRVEVSIKGATLEQTVKLLHSIEEAPLHLLIRSLRIRTQRMGSRIDASFFVSSFERAAPAGSG